MDSETKQKHFGDEAKWSGGEETFMLVRSYGKSLITSNIQTLFERMRDIQLLVP